MVDMLKPDEPNMFRYLKESGYDVFWHGKNDMLAQASFPGSVTEWSEARGATNGTFLAGGGKSLWPFGDPRYYSFLYGPGGDRHQYSDYLNVQAAIRILEQDRKRPFCIFLPLIFPHPPYSAPRGFYSMYNPSEVPRLRPIGLPRKPASYQPLRHALGLDRFSESDFRKVSAVYLGMVSYVDWVFGELLNALDRTGHNRDTAVFFCSDHGDYAGDYGLVEKGWSDMVDDLNHVPLIVRIPGGVKGHVVDELVELFDIMPTCLNLAGTKPHHTHFARSLIPQLQGKAGDANRLAHCEAGWNINEPQNQEPLAELGSNPRYNVYYTKLALELEHPELLTRTSMVQDRNLKLVVRPYGQSELYDLMKDPEQLNNVYGDRSYSSVQEAMFMHMLDWYVRTSDVAPWIHDARGLPSMPTPLTEYRLGGK